MEQNTTITAPVVKDNQATWEPWARDDGVVGWRVMHDDGREEYVYLFPAQESDDDSSVAFVYHGTEGDPREDTPLTHIDLFTECDRELSPRERMDADIARNKVHKATLSPTTPLYCAICGQRIKRVLGGQGPTWVHSDSGAVAAPTP